MSRSAPNDPYPERIVCLTEEPTEVLYHLGMAQEKVGKNREAQASLEKSLALNPSFPGAEEARATLEHFLAAGTAE